MKTIKIKELGIEVTYPIVWTKPYNEIIIPKGWRKIEIWELWFILDGSKYMDKFLGKFKGEFNYFWCEQADYAKKKNYSSRLYLSRNLNLASRYWNVNLSYSDEDGRVVFARDLK